MKVLPVMLNHALYHIYGYLYPSYCCTYQNLQSRFGIERHAYTKSRIDQIPCVCMYV